MNSDSLPTPKQRKLIALGALLILLTAGWMRLWDLSKVPPGLFGDEAANGLDALDVLAGHGKIFFTGNYGREGLQMWLLAASIHLFGLNPTTLRIPSVIAGVVTALAAYWIGYEMFIIPSLSETSDTSFFRAWLIAFAAGIFTSFSFYHVLFSRFGGRVVFTSTLTGLTVASLWRALRLSGALAMNSRESRPKWLWWAITGGFMGLALHFYSASRFLPVFIGVFLTVWLLLDRDVSLHSERQTSKKWILAAGLMFGVAAIVFSPLAYYFVTHPGTFTERAKVVSPFEHGSGPEVLKVVIRSAKANLLQFIIPGRGDAAQFHNIPGRPVFMPLTASLAVIGMSISLWKWKDSRHKFLLLWFLIMVSPSFFAVDRYPTCPRIIGTVPGIFFFPALGMVGVLNAIKGLLARSEIMRQKNRELRILLYAVTALALLQAGYLTYRDYFKVWGRDPATADAYEIDMITAWHWLESHPTYGPIFLSSDIYKHPTFVLLYEKVPTSIYFTNFDPRLHWFDARRAWPLPSDLEPTTIIVGNSAVPPKPIQDLLGIHLIPLNKGTAFLPTRPTIDIPPRSPIWFSPQVGLVEQLTIAPHTSEENGWIVQVWRTRSAVQAETDVDPYQIQSALVGLDRRQVVTASDQMGVRPTQWGTNEVWITWQKVRWPKVPLKGSAIRILTHNKLPLRPPGNKNGWVTFFGDSN